MPRGVPPPDWDEVDRYVRARLASKGDTFGWMRIEDSEDPAAVILVGTSAESQSFPSAIGGVRIHVRRLSPPERP